ncbi:MAG: hypothetical protein ICV56_07840 [Nitrososphaeraceae archaeon]|nr:hypothetical protein [Nitrososphaeraceae archaeon]
MSDTFSLLPNKRREGEKKRHVQKRHLLDEIFDMRYYIIQNGVNIGNRKTSLVRLHILNND